MSIRKISPGKRCRIVLTGGPGGGKTTAADLLRREIGEKIVIVPEAATLLFSGGLPRSEELRAQRAAQRAIYHVQTSLEDIQRSLYPKRTLLCDRGTVDGAAFWPEGDGDFFEQVNSSLEEEFERYDAVIFFESAAVGNLSIEGGNPVRNESIDQAIKLNSKLHDIWSKHPNFFHIPHEQSFFHKLENALKVLTSTIETICE